MAILLVHLRRLILLMSIVYLSGAFLGRLLTESPPFPNLQLLNGSRQIWAKQLHFQWWAYIYAGYAYVLLVNYVAMRRTTNLLEFFLT